MLKVKKTKIEIDSKTKKRVEFYLDRTSRKYKFICGNLIKLNTTNLTYVEPHKAIFEDFMILFFNYSDQIYVNNLIHQISYEDIYDYVKLKKYENDFDF